MGGYQRRVHGDTPLVMTSENDLLLCVVCIALVAFAFCVAIFILRWSFATLVRFVVAHRNAILFVSGVVLLLVFTLWSGGATVSLKRDERNDGWSAARTLYYLNKPDIRFESENAELLWNYAENAVAWPSFVWVAWLATRVGFDVGRLVRFPVATFRGTHWCHAVGKVILAALLLVFLIVVCWATGGGMLEHVDQRVDQRVDPTSVDPTWTFAHQPTWTFGSNDWPRGAWEFGNLLVVLLTIHTAFALLFPIILLSLVGHAVVAALSAIWVMLGKVTFYSPRAGRESMSSLDDSALGLITASAMYYGTFRLYHHLVMPKIESLASPTTDVWDLAGEAMRGVGQAVLITVDLAMHTFGLIYIVSLAWEILGVVGGCFVAAIGTVPLMILIAGLYQHRQLRDIYWDLFATAAFIQQQWQTAAGNAGDEEHPHQD